MAESVDSMRAVIVALASDDLATRAAAARQLFNRPLRDSSGAFNLEAIYEDLRRGWSTIRPDRGAVVASLRKAFLSDSGLLTIEAIAFALAAAGEDGIGELIEALGHDDFSIRHKAVIAIGGLNRSGRWAVGPLVRAYALETESLVRINIIDALGRIGGNNAVAALECWLNDARADSEAAPELLDRITEALLASQRVTDD